jgi:hypothetical protein
MTQTVGDTISGSIQRDQIQFGLRSSLAWLDVWSWTTRLEQNKRDLCKVILYNCSKRVNTVYKHKHENK